MGDYSDPKLQREAGGVFWDPDDVPVHRQDMQDEDDLAISLAAERRQHEAAEQAEEDARRAELPRLMRHANGEAKHLGKSLWRRIFGGGR